MLASQAVEYEVTISDPYKVCDLRPLYGLMFSDWLNAYHFWGYCDLDLVWGDIRKWMTAVRLERYDILTSTRCSIAGQYTILRNCSVTNNLFRLIPDYLARLKAQEYFGCDEVLLNDAAIILERSEVLRVWRRQVQVGDIYSPEWDRWSRRLEGENPGWDEPYEWLSGACRWEEGRVFHAESGKEVMFFHFMSWKRAWNELPVRLWTPRIRAVDIYGKGLKLRYRGCEPVFAAIYKIFYEAPNRVMLGTVRGVNVGFARLRIIGGAIRKCFQMVSAALGSLGER